MGRLWLSLLLILPTICFDDSIKLELVKGERTLDGKVVLTRVDVNVPVEDGRVTDATRIEKIVPTIKAIQAKGGIPVLMAHFGRPKGQPVEAMSLRQVLPALEAALGQPVAFAEHAIGGDAKRAVAALQPARHANPGVKLKTDLLTRACYQKEEM